MTALYSEGRVGNWVAESIRTLQNNLGIKYESTELKQLCKLEGETSYIGISEVDLIGLGD